jgi:nucleotidyltransferase substrate binding protein (TIGR01987 family)
MKKKSETSEIEQFSRAIKALKHALSFEKQSKKDIFYFSGIAKSFESAVEYSWKFFKRKVQQEGLDVYSPREAIKQAGRIGLIDDVELWLMFVDTRNLAVHDYLEIDQSEYLEIIKNFYKEAVRFLQG